MRALLLVLATLLCFAACKKPSPSKALNATEINKLLEAARSTELNMEEKYQLLIQSYTDLLREALNKGSDEEMRIHLATYRSQNQEALIMMEGLFDDWQKNMTDEERMYFVVNLIHKPATQQLNYLAPRAEARLKAYPDDYKELRRMLMRLDLRR